MDIQTISQFVLSGLSTGCIYALVAIGYVLCFNATGVINFAQGEYVMVGALTGAWAHSVGVPLPLCIAAAIAAGMLLGAIQERFTLAPVRAAPDFIRVTVTFAFAVLIRGVALVAVGVNPLPLPGFTGDDVFEPLGAILPTQVAWVWGFTAVILVAVFVFLMRTRWGRAVRACADNMVAARLMGISPEKVTLLVLVLSGGAGALGGIVVAPITLASWSLGSEFALKGFIAALLGGFKSPMQAVVAALAIGVIETLAAGFVSSGSRDIVVYGLLVVYLVISSGLKTTRTPLTMKAH